jgi:hypothetical protein
VNLVVGIFFVVSDFVVTVFPAVTDKFVGVLQRTGQSSSQRSTIKELKDDMASKKFRKTVVFPAQVAEDIGSMSPEICENSPTQLPTSVVPMESSTVDHNHDIVDQGFVRGPWLRGTKDQGRETQWNGNLKQNLDRPAVTLPVEETIPVKRIISSKTRKMSSRLSLPGQFAQEKDATF